MPVDALTHNENCLKVCIVCFQKGSSMKEIVGPVLLRRVRNFYIDNFDPSDFNLPGAICGRCRNLLLKLERGDASLDVLPEPFDFSKIVPSPTTRSLTTCTCVMCEVARETPFTLGQGPASVNPFPIGRPKQQEKPPLATPRPITVCKRCWQPVGKGISHPKPCTANNARENLCAAVKEIPRARSLIASDLIKDKASSSEGSAIKISTRGADLTVPKPAPRHKTSKALFHNRPIPAEELIKFQTSLGLSLKQTEHALTFIRTWKGRGVVEPIAMDKLRDRDRDLDAYYSTAVLDMDSSLKEDTRKVKRSVVYCHDVKSLVDHVIEFQGALIDDYMIKIGIDGGGSFLKFCLNIISCDVTKGVPERKRAKYQEGAFSDKFADSGVKKLLIIAIVEEVKESYENLVAILNLVGLNRVDFMAAFDMKLANAFLCLGTHSSAYPCPWCEVPKSDFANPARVIELRTLGMIRKRADEYQAASAAHKGKRALSAAAFKSCIHPPLVKSLPDDTHVIDFLPVIELHVLLGITNRLYDHVDDLLKCSAGSGQAKDWSDELSIRRPPMHGGEFNGSQCTKLLENTVSLQRILMHNEVGEKGHNVVHALDSFNDVRRKCFGTVLHDDYKEAISKFETDYKNLGIPVTLKCHAVVNHICQFLEAQKELFNQQQSSLSDTEQTSFNRGLGFWSEQASESVHLDFNKLWQSGGYKRDLNHRDYAQKLLKCVITYCARHK